jgi:hypothetical protein
VNQRKIRCWTSSPACSAGLDFHANTEVTIQSAIKLLLDSKGLDYEAEKALDAKNRVDFLVQGSVAVEVKVQGSAK